MARMSFDYGLEKANSCLLKKYQWLLHIPGVSASGINSLPPSKASRPSLSFKEIEIQHVSETISRPGRPEWKPVPLTLFDLKKNNGHPVFEWLKKIYDAEQGHYYASMDNDFLIDGYLEMLNGCGDVLETWNFENMWPQNIDFGELDMGNSEFVTCDLSIKFDRAYIRQGY